METQTEVMRKRVHRIGRGYHSAHRRTVQPRTVAFPVTVASTPPAAPASGAPEVRYESPAPHALVIVGGWVLALAAGVMLGVQLAQHWG
jgi:hypothetical protein